MFFFLADPHAFHRHFHLVNRVDLETVLQAVVLVNDRDGQVRAAHKILGYVPLQKSFADPRHVISASRPRLPKITVVESGFLISEGSSVPEGILLADLSSSHQVAEDEGELDQSEEGFGVFDLANQSEDPSGDIGDSALSEAELSSVGTSSQTGMGLKRKPPTSLFDLLEGQPTTGAQETPSSSVPSTPPQPQTIQTRSSSTKLQPQSPRPKLPASPQPALPPRPGPLTQRERGVPRVRKPWMGENPNLPRRGMKPCV